MQERNPSFVGLPRRAPSPSPVASTFSPAGSFAMTVSAPAGAPQSHRLYTMPNAGAAVQVCPSFVPSEASRASQGSAPPTASTGPSLPPWMGGFAAAAAAALPSQQQQQQQKPPAPQQQQPQRSSAPNLTARSPLPSGPLHSGPLAGSPLPTSSAVGHGQSLSWVPPSEPSWVLQMEVAQCFVDQNSHLNGVQRSRSWEPPTSREPSFAHQPLSSSFPDAPEGASFADGGCEEEEEEDDGPAPLRFVSGSASRQHPAKMHTGIVNADAVDEGACHLGICDGVSGVHHLGIPVDELPRELLRSCQTVLDEEANAEALQAAGEADARGRRASRSRRRSSRFAGKPAARRDSGSGGAQQGEPEDDGTWLVGVIQRAYDATEAFGATTLLLAALRGSDLVAACLGDCALLVLRPCASAPMRLRAVFKTEPGRYDSRRPVQVQRLQGFSSSHAHAVIQGAMVSTTPVQPGDYLILGSDGLFDNLPDDDIIRTVERCCGPAALGGSWQHQVQQQAAVLPSQDRLRGAATALVDLAISRVRLDQLDSTQTQPWSAQGDVPANNADDTTAVVALVTEEMCRRPEVAREAAEVAAAGRVQYNGAGVAVLQDRTNTAPTLFSAHGLGVPPKVPHAGKGGFGMGPPPQVMVAAAETMRGREAAKSSSGIGTRSMSADASFCNHGSGTSGGSGVAVVQTARGSRRMSPPAGARTGASSHRELRRDECVIA